MDNLIEKFKDIDQLLAKVPVTGDYTGALALALLGVILFLTFLILSKRRIAPDSDEVEVPPETTAEETIESTEEEAVIKRDDVVEFFLRLFKVQLGAPQEAKAKFKALDGEAGNKRRTYEIEVFHDKKWVSRRMTIGRAGGGSASRSQCYHVIYDDHFVVKIPCKPITNFSAYISAIESDHRIARRITPRECIVPTVSAVMKIIHPFSDGKQLTPAALEDKYLDWLRKYPSFQSHLKIGRSYIFVMDLSRYFFLSHIINDVHDLPDKVYQEIVGYPDVIWENHGFEGRYAEENDEQIDTVRAVFKIFEEQSGHLLKKTGKHKLPRFTLQKWFLIHLAGGELTTVERDLKPEAVKKFNDLLRKILSDNKDVIENYRKTIRRCVQAVTVSQNNHQIAGLVTNLFELVAWLRSKTVAMRDMKPDNLLVAGDKARYPEFLNAITDYSVGLIDVETAVVYGTREEGRVPQPVLGGTPSYATPAHLMPNTALKNCFQDISRILYYQDLHAAVAIAYEMITGERLYDQTAKLIIGVKPLILKNMDNPAAQFEIFKNASRMFWHSAQTEIANRFKEKQDVLRLVNIVPTDSVRAMFRQELLNGKEILDRRVVSLVARQKVLANEKTRRALIAASHQKISQVKLKWQAARYKGSAQGLKLLDTLEALKLSSERSERLIRQFAAPSLSIAVDDLLRILFDIVRQGMYREEWGELVAAEVVGVGGEKSTSTVEATV